MAKSAQTAKARRGSAIRESYQELRKVQWPTRLQIAQGTMVVVFVTAVFGIYLTIVDRVVSAAIIQIDKWLT